MGSTKPSLFCIRFFIFILLSGLSAISVYIYHIHNILGILSNQVHDQQVTIQRFNNTVTNSDLQAKVESLEQSIKDERASIQQSLSDTTTHIQSLLTSTLTKLDTTVNSAEIQIQNEVASVKDDVSQYVRTTQDQFSTENSFMVYQIAGTFTVLACLIAMWHITAHIRNLNRPIVQRKVLAILWMSPIYSITSWLSLVFSKYEGYLGIFKDFYEAYVIYQFFSFCLSVLGDGDRDAVVDLLSHHADRLKPPMRICGWCRGTAKYESPRDLADAVLLQCQFFVMQFVFFQPLTTTLLFICNQLEFYGAGKSSSDYRSPQFWITIIQNISFGLAFDGLLKCYHVVSKQLAWCRPFPKFVCIKGIVFMTFWQGLAITILANGAFGSSNSSDNDKSPETWARQSQNFLICLEMLLFSIAHFYCFPTEEWQDGYRPAAEKKFKMGDNMALGDFFSDMKLIMGGVLSKETLKKEKFEIEVEYGEMSSPTSPSYGSVSDVKGEEIESVENMDTGELKPLIGSASSFKGDDSLASGKSNAQKKTGKHSLRWKKT